MNEMGNVILTTNEWFNEVFPDGTAFTSEGKLIVGLPKYYSNGWYFVGTGNMTKAWYVGNSQIIQQWIEPVNTKPANYTFERSLSVFALCFSLFALVISLSLKRKS